MLAGREGTKLCSQLNIAFDEQADEITAEEYLPVEQDGALGFSCWKVAACWINFSSNRFGLELFN